MQQLPVYIFTGFLEGGKTTIIQESLADQNFNTGEKTLLLLCEEGIEEYDPSAFWGKNVTIYTIENESDLTEKYLLTITKGKKIDSDLTVDGFISAFTEKFAKGDKK